MVLRFTSGSLNGQSGTVANYVGATRTFEFSPGTFTAAPNAADAFVVDAPVNGSVASVASATQFSGAAPLATADNWYNGRILRFTSGPLAGQSGTITGYTGSTRTFTFSSGTFSTQPGMGNSFLISGPVNRIVSPSGANVTATNPTTWNLTPVDDITLTTGQYALSLIAGNGILNVAGGTAHPAATGPMQWWQGDKLYQNGGALEGPNGVPGLYV